jgi:chemotaxis protein methyltransferase CheR
MEDNLLRELSKMIYDYCGLRYSDRLPTLRDRVAKRLNELQLPLWEYCGYLRNTPQEWDQLVELLTINETYFYREENQ